MATTGKGGNRKHKKWDRLTPIFECVEQGSNGRLIAHFGYRNDKSQQVTIPVGPQNLFHPKPADRGQPTQFATGTQTNVFTVEFNRGALVWSLDGRITVATKDSKRCGVAPTPDAGTDVPVPPMCPASCNDNNACTSDCCDAATGQCVNTPVAAGQSCSDSNACNGAETCNGQGVCSPGTAPNCDDQNPCTTDSCTATGGCTHTPGNEGGSCADANACNGAEVCRAGVCAPAPALNCDDANPCTIDTCNAATGCAHAPQPPGFVCAPATQCGGASTCVGTVCAAGPGGSCDDNNPCTADSCSANGTCAHAPLDGIACNDGNACNGSEMCRAGTCAAGTPVVCTASDQCHNAGTCDQATGMCSNPAKADGATCNDGNACTDTDVCRAGSCGGAPKTCTPSDQCHIAGVCDPTTGTCSNPVAVGKTCDDGNTCTMNDVCSANGSCAGSGTCGPTPCERCQADNCPADIAGCSSLTGQDRIDCDALFACTERTNCADGGDGQSCYCGTADIGACLGTGANGECKAEVEVAGKSTNAQILAERFTDPTFPVGLVFNLYGCRVALCSDVCTP